MKVKEKRQTQVYEVIGNYKINGKPGYVLIANSAITNILEEHCEPVITIADMVQGRKYKFPHQDVVYLCINKPDSTGITFTNTRPYVVCVSSGAIYPMNISLDSELVEVK